MTAAEEAIRQAVPKMEAIAVELCSYQPYDLANDCDEHGFELRDIAADLLSALDGPEGDSGPTTAQEGQEGRSGQMGGVSGDVTGWDLSNIGRSRCICDDEGHEHLGAANGDGTITRSCLEDGCRCVYTIKRWVRCSFMSHHEQCGLSAGHSLPNVHLMPDGRHVDDREPEETQAP